MEDGRKLEQRFKDDEALTKYIAALQIQPKNVMAAVKIAELNCAIGARQTNVDLKKSNYTEAKNYAATCIATRPAKR